VCPANDLAGILKTALGWRTENVVGTQSGFSTTQEHARLYRLMVLRRRPSLMIRDVTDGWFVASRASMKTPETRSSRG
jgi:hypothetical protein